MTQEKLPHRKELCLQSEPLTFVRGYFCLSQCIELTSSSWLEHTVRAQRVHEVQGTSAWTDRSGDHKFNFRWFNHGLNAANSLQSP